MVPRKIKIKTVLNGWEVRVGYKDVVFTDQGQMFAALARYLDDPEAVEKEYTEGSVNARHFKQVPPFGVSPFADFCLSVLNPIKDEERKPATETAAIGAAFGGGFFGGEITIDGERYALIVAPKTAGEKMDIQYKLNDRSTADGTDSDDDGLANTNRISDDNHPAASFCRSLKIGGFNDWYLPSRDELAMLWRHLGQNRKNTPELFRAGASESFEDCWYWSSTEHASGSGYAWVVYFYSGSQSNVNKSFSDGVRAVRRIKL